MAPSKWFTTNSSTNSLVISKKNALPLPNGLVESNEGVSTSNNILFLLYIILYIIFL